MIKKPCNVKVSTDTHILEKNTHTHQNHVTIQSGNANKTKTLHQNYLFFSSFTSRIQH